MIDSLPQITLKNRSSTFHPWVWWKQVGPPKTHLRPGTIVDVMDEGGEWYGRGFYNGHARIRVRILTQNRDEKIDEAWLSQRLEESFRYRIEALKLPEKTSAFRLVHSEGDGLSGLVIDKYMSVYVVQYFSAGMFRFRTAIERFIKERDPSAEIYSYAQRHTQKQESFDLRSVEPPPAPLVIQENGVSFHVVPGMRHKTGFYLDQRENRKHLSQLCMGLSVLDLCCFTGGFSLYAKLLGGAREVTGVDWDTEAIRMARGNAKLNGIDINFVEANLFDWVPTALQKGQSFDVVILDPSKQTRSLEDLGLALRRYQRLNTLALQLVRPGGLLLTSSCSGLVKEKQFLGLISKVASRSQRKLQLLDLTGAGADHRVTPEVPETKYLKAAWYRVE